MQFLSNKVAYIKYFGIFSFSCFSAFCFSSENQMTEFDSAFFNIENKEIVNKFSFNNYIPQGVYPVDVFVNESFVKKVSLEVKESSDGNSYPCINMDILSSLGLSDKALELDASMIGSCIDIGKKIPNATVNFNMGMSTLDFKIPQLYLNNTARGYVDPSRWDEGISAFYISYDMFGSRIDNDKSLSTYLNTGINVGSWYFKHKGVYNWSEYSGEQYNSIDSYLYKPIAAIKSNFIIGEKNTNGRLFDTVPLIGLQLYDDPNMLPDSQRGYAPEIFGVAKTNAIVKIEQNGNIIYETLVTPGEFLINDLYPSGYGGNLNVTIYEADGTEQKFSVPYESLAEMLRPNTSRYSLSIGRYKNDRLLFKPLFIEGTYEYGISNHLTAFGGGQVSEDYLAVQGGVALGTDIGTFSLGGTQSYVSLDGYYAGQSYELKYSKNIYSIGTNISLGAYRYSTEEYMDYQTAMLFKDNVERGYMYNDLYNSKNRYLATIGQTLPGNYGSFYMSGAVENSWDEANYSRQYQASYNNNYHRLSFGLTATRYEDQNGEFQTSYALSFSTPLGDDGELSNARLRFNINRSEDGYQYGQIGLSDTVGEDRLLSYDIAASRTDDNSENAINGHVSYITPVATVSANASKGKDYNSSGFGLSGTLVGHSDGVTLSPYSGSTFALVEAEGMDGATVSGYKGVKIDSDGYAVVPNLRPYQLNHIYIDPVGTSTNVELANTVKDAAPYDGAIVKLEYKTTIGFSVLINSQFMGKPLPFGAVVIDEEGNGVGHVAQGSIIYARTKKRDGTLWIGVNGEEYCSIKYNLTDEQTEPPLKMLNLECK